MGGAIAFSANQALAQVTPDATLGAEGSVVASPQPGGFQIDGGATRGANLFHSFSQFSVPPNGFAYFNNALTIQNIITRVTGTSGSNIDGLIRANGTANVFLMNPNGITFGQNARLDIGGSFVGTTANSIRFPGGGEFSQTSTQATLNNPVLALNPSALFFNQTPQQIVNQSRALSPTNPNSSEGLRVRSGRSLFLVGGEVNLNGGIIRAPGGRVELGGLAAPGEVELKVLRDNKLGLGFPDGVARANISLANQAGITTSILTGGGEDAGIVILRGNNVSIDNSKIFSQIAARGQGDAGGILIEAGSLSLSNNAGLASSSFGSGNAGAIVLKVDGSVSLSDNSTIQSNVENGATNSNGGVIGITAGSLSLLSGSQIQTLVRGNENGKPAGQGNAGTILIDVKDTITIDGVGFVNGQAFPSAIFSSVGSGSTGNAGNILISTRALSLSNRGKIDSSLAGVGTAGSILIEAKDSISLSNGARIETLIQQGGTGNADGILIQARSVLTDNSRVGSSTYGIGSAGLVYIKATDSVVLTNNSFIDSGVAGSGKGDAGGILIEAGSISISNATRVTTETNGQGNGGVTYLKASGDISITGSGTLVSSNVEQGATGNTLGVRIDARSLFMSGGSNIQALTRGNGSAGKILINASDLVDLRGVSPTGGFSTGLFTSTEGNATGEGGLIEVNAGTLRLSDAAVLSARTQTASDGGGILVKVNTLELLNGGQILATAYSSGSSGVILINAKDKITLSGRDPTYINRILQIYENYVAQFGVDEAIKLTIQTFDNVPPGSSGIFANVLSGSTGAAGGILITTKDLFIRDGGTISVDNPGPREAGDIIILARDLIMKNQATINARATSGQGGNILLFPNTFLLLLQNSRISTTSGFQGKGGDGGNVFIDNRYTIAAPFDDNNINANAFTGTGGNIRIIADRLYDIAKRSIDVSGSNDITASSDFGLDGTVRTPPLVADPTRGLANLPADPVDPSSLMAETCAPRGGIAERQKNRFIVTGRGGLPPDPNAAFPGEAVVNDLGTPEQEGTNSTDEPNSINPGNPTPTATASPQQPEIVEAQGWVYGKDGDIIFTAQAPTVTPNSPVLTPASTCNAVSTLPQ
jgi:filamentous hemagglutinin family protein